MTGTPDSTATGGTTPPVDLPHFVVDHVLRDLDPGGGRTVLLWMPSRERSGLVLAAQQGVPMADRLVEVPPPAELLGEEDSAALRRGQLPEAIAAALPADDPVLAIAGRHHLTGSIIGLALMAGPDSGRPAAAEPQELSARLSSACAIMSADHAPLPAGALADEVLEAIPDQAAVLSRDGVVMAANRAWETCPEEHGWPIPRSPVGAGYLADLQAHADSARCRIAADGIQAVLVGSLPTFQSDYDAGRAAASNSYTLHVDPLPSGGVLVRHVDISFRKHLERQLAHRATHDHLTGLPNRMVVNDRLAQALVRASRTEERVAVLFCDVDHFKDVNDSLGHSVGDQVLRIIAERLTRVVRQTDIVARFGGDEFVLMLESVPDEQFVRDVAGELLRSVTQPIEINGRQLYFGVSVGAALNKPGAGQSPMQVDELLGDADAAMYHAKESGRNQIAFFQPEYRNKATQRIDLAAALRDAAPRRQFTVLTQPIVALPEGRLYGYEAFVRWNLPGVGVLAPADFLLDAEESGLIAEIDRTVLHQACEFLAEANAISPIPLRLAVNTAWHEAQRGDFARAVRDVLASTGIDPDNLDLELTIPSEPGDFRDSVTQLRDLREDGVHITLDAIGRNPVNLSAMQSVPADAVKIDRVLMSHLGSHDRIEPLVAGMARVARGMGLRVVAEGVETDAHAQAAAAVGCTHAQGYYFGAPVLPEESLTALRQGRLLFPDAEAGPAAAKPPSR